ncbi:MAG: hypothetical protein AAF840_11655, partial [Bacteroidota bacterium]
KVTADNWGSTGLHQASAGQQLSYDVERAFNEQYIFLKVNQTQCLMDKAQDFRDACGSATNCPAYDAINDFVNAPFPAAPSGNYSVKIEYRIAPEITPTSSFDIYFVKQ